MAQVPGTPLHDQEPAAMTNMRNLHPVHKKGHSAARSSADDESHDEAPQWVSPKPKKSSSSRLRASKDVGLRCARASREPFALERMQRCQGEAAVPSRAARRLTCTCARHLRSQSACARNL